MTRVVCGAIAALLIVVFWVALPPTQLDEWIIMIVITLIYALFFGDLILSLDRE